MDAKVDTLTQKGNGFKAEGTVAQRLLKAGMRTDGLRPWIGDDGNAYVTVNGTAVPVTNATLRKDEWKHYDKAVIKVAQERLVGVADLNARGLVYNVPNGLGTIVLEYEDMSDTTAAEVSMDGVTRTKDDRVEFDLNYLPLPLVHKGFHINIRVLAASRTTGRPLDTTMAEVSGRKVSEKLEDMLFNGLSTYTYGGGTIYGYTDFPSRNTVTLSTNWDDSASNGESILDDVRAMKQALIDAKFYGPYILYIPTNYDTVMDDDFKSNSDKTIRQRILEVDRIEAIRVADKLTDDNVLLVQMTSDVVRMVNGLPIQTVEWDTEGGTIFHFKIMTIQVPQIRADQDGNCGVCHLS